MVDTSASAHQSRLKAFAITADHLRLLALRRSAFREALPALLEDLHGSFAAWPQIQAALRHPEVHRVRLAHWQRVAGGEFDSGFYPSAQALARILFEHGAPSYAVTLCHATVANGIVHRLIAPAPRWLGRSQEKENLALREAVNMVAWFDLEVLLETYAEAEQEARRTILQGFATNFESSIDSVITGVTGSTTRLGSVVKDMDHAAEQTSQQMTIAAGAAQEVNSNIHTVAAATEELSSSIHEITRQVNQSAQTASRAVESANRTNTVVQALAEAAGRIGDVVKMIGDIAGQTNLLALNATIEAARAGESGKGFAVVASEVKGLASQTAKATDEIRDQIGQMQVATGKAVEAIREITVTVSEMGGISTAIAAAVEQQGSATAEISRNVQNLAAGNRTVEQQMRGLEASAAGNQRMAGEVRDATGGLGQRVKELNQSVGAFLKQLRAS